jgi:hypothetical protein
MASVVFAKLTKATAFGGDVLTVKGADAEEVAKLILATAERADGDKTTRASHTSYPSPDAAMVLLQSIV